MATEDAPRLTFQESLELIQLPPLAGAPSSTRRFMSTKTAHVPGIELEFEMHKAAYGGHVYGQAALAACRVIRELEDQKQTKPSERLGLHVCARHSRPRKADH